MHKIWQVIRFEVLRNLKKPSFWLAAILVPALIVIYIWIAGLAGYQAGESIESGTDTSTLSLAIYDASGYLQNTTFINTNGDEQSLVIYDNKASGIADIKAQTIDVFYYIPADFAENSTVEIYTKPEYASILDDYSTPLRTLLSSNALINVSAIDYAIITGGINYQTTTFDHTDDHVVDSTETISKLLAPALALIMFYLLIVVLGNRIIAAMTEEKENRISELVLTSINPTNLIVGKIISLMILGLIQLTILVIPVIILYQVCLKYDAIPFDITLSFDALSLIKYALFLIASYFLFTSFCVAIGAVSPTAKDANSFSSVIIILVILPIFFIGSFAGTPQAITYILTYFPPSAPIAAMLRAIFGSLPTWEFWLAFADIIIVSALTTKLATYLFQRNAIDFTAKFSLKNLLRSPRTTWKK